LVRYFEAGLIYGSKRSLSRGDWQVPTANFPLEALRKASRDPVERVREASRKVADPWLAPYGQGELFGMSAPLLRVPSDPSPHVAFLAVIR